MSAVGSNYISDGQIMAWLATQQDRIYGDLKDSMDLAERRADFQSALSNVKTQLVDANESKDFSAVDKELQELMTMYGSDPSFAEACEQLEGLANKIHADWDYRVNVYPAVKAAYDAAEVVNALRQDTGNQGGRGGYVASSAGELKVPERPVDKYTDEQIESWTNLIGGQVDNLGRNDQLAMIHIQELKATLDQGSQLASTFISSGDKTNSAIINNIA